MNPLLDKYLCEKYPKIFINRGKSMQESCMYWGLDVGDGWFYLIDALCFQIQQHCDYVPYVPKKDIRTRLLNLWNRTGWNYIVHPLVKKLPIEEYQKYSKRWQFTGETYEESKNPVCSQVEFDQVKEKFAGLRIYSSGGDDFIRGLVSMAESISYRTCEKCGKMDKTIGVTSGWYTTLCPEHAKDRKSGFTLRDDEQLEKIWKQIEDEDKRKTTPNVS